MEKRTKLQSLCATRWAAMADALFTFVSAFTAVESALNVLATEHGDTKAASYRSGILSFDFIVTLVAVEYILSGVVPLSKMLQKENCDLVQASLEARVLTAQLDTDRNDDSTWDSLFTKAVVLAQQVGVEPSIPRNAKRQENRPNAPAATPSDFWRRNMYKKFVDHLITELRDRLLVPHGRFRAQYLIPNQVGELENETVQQIFTEFEADINGDIDQFCNEVRRWKTRWRAVTPKDVPNSLETAIKRAPLELYPNIRMCLSILLAMPVSTATAERSFSTMKRVKTYLRNTMTTERLSGLGLINIYRDREISSERVVDIFARRNNRRLALIFRV
ncbi:52 kDa repressor of the inhibitor of the protein kinase-like [Mya arenaria]|uniref:52 kDa repressor of the inhibitor of the protein kinase-like n=1 Tax=Mya arenaria TaxID=6604 RepID=UPI0022DF26A7|nr:52 kDa repressor of the inhibitor of the protein kinase-like [Mya arenaria]